LILSRLAHNRTLGWAPKVQTELRVGVKNEERDGRRMIDAPSPALAPCWTFAAVHGPDVKFQQPQL
jgi:hypothetical protein